MKLFECQHCGQLLYFENTRCERCGHVLGYMAESAVLSALTPEDDARWRPLAAPETLFRLCANAGYEACNWLVPADGRALFCRPAGTTGRYRTSHRRATCCAGSVSRPPSTA